MIRFISQRWRVLCTGPAHPTTRTDRSETAPGAAQDTATDGSGVPSGSRSAPADVQAGSRFSSQGVRASSRSSNEARWRRASTPAAATEGAAGVRGENLFAARLGGDPGFMGGDRAPRGVGRRGETGSPPPVARRARVAKGRRRGLCGASLRGRALGRDLGSDDGGTKDTGRKKIVENDMNKK